ncbi:response regulator transcription factor [Exilibacterium tricleocarpae]|uniref:Response regulator transcription factor n=1 Tax=Exilibacterium tricleocarpae TaxID=2591008 RepID=A0A545U862_9GAMM|nr:response regulator transcription factor [Exilibacterium tricleocarpae]TQV85662.1 response regulator transcription factor [Exilibacterium tricleocarpae]
MLHFHIADDHPLFRSALLDVINQHFVDADITESSDLDTTLAALEQLADIDLLLLDINMPGSQDLFGLVSVREKFPSVPVAMVSASEDPDTISKAIGHGASAYIPKSVSPRDIYQALNAVLAGDKWVPAAVRQQLKPVGAEEKNLAAKIAALTPQQYKVLCYLREGLLNKQIGYELGVTEATVKAHITAIFRKLGVSNRTQAVIVLAKMSLEEP